MEDLFTTCKNGTLYIGGIPDAHKVVELDGKIAKRLSDLALHKYDLDFAKDCIDAMAEGDRESEVILQSLWRSSIIHYIKCFDASASRSQLSAEKIFGAGSEHLTKHRYFKNIRNKYFVHDENAYSQSLVGAVINDGKKEYKVEKIVFNIICVETLDDVGYDNMSSLINISRSFVIKQIEHIFDVLTKELEREPYEKLSGRKKMIFRVPTIDDVSEPRACRV